MSKKRLSRKRTRVWKKKKWPKWARHVWVYRVEVGTHKSSASLIKAIKTERTNHYPIRSSGFRICRRNRVLDLLFVRISDLRIRTSEASLNQICRQAKILGLRMCPQETALQIARQWRVLPEILLWPKREFCWLTVASRRLNTRNECANTFVLRGKKTEFFVDCTNIYSRRNQQQFKYDDWWAFELPQENSRGHGTRRRN